jgi:hypothetical protein
MQLRLHSLSFFLPLLLVGAYASAQNAAVDIGKPLLARSYREGETISYHMSASNQGRNGTIHYEADAKGTVKKNGTGFDEEYEWSNLKFNGQSAPLPPGSETFRQEVSLDAAVSPTMPDFSRISPMLIGPAADMLTFYADEWLALKQGALRKPGDHAYVKHGTPNSWADGVHTIVGQDSIDFDVTIGNVDTGNHTAEVLVRHVPPAQPQIKIPAGLMSKEVADTANNWVEVSKTGDGKYLAEIGKEIFDVKLIIGLSDGKILSATMNNPVTVMARECTNEALSQCGAPEHYEIRRQVEIKLLQ